MIEKSHRYKLSPVCEWLVIVLFLVAIVAPGIGQLFGRSDTTFIQKVEFRTPAPPVRWPASLEELKDFPAEAETFVDDHFGFRSWLSTMNSWLLVMVGSSGSDLVIRGQSGFLFFDDGRNVEELRGAYPIREAELDRWIDRMTSIQQWLESQGIELIIAVLPSKQTIYPEYLPEWAKPIGPTRFEKLTVRLREHNELTVIDTRPGLFETKNSSAPLIYYRNDTHWNPIGAYRGYQQIMTAVKEKFPASRVVTDDQFQFVDGSEGSPGGLKRISNVSWAFDEPLAPAIKFESGSKVSESEVFEDGRWRRCDLKEVAEDMWRPAIVRTTVVDAPRAVIFRDSFTTALLPFFNQSFSEILYDHHHQSKIDKNLVTSFDPDVVLLVMVENSLIYKPRFRTSEESHQVAGSDFDDGKGESLWTPDRDNFVFGGEPVSWIVDSGFYKSQQVAFGPARWTDGHGTLTIPLDGESPPRILEVSLIGWVQREGNFEIVANGVRLLAEPIPDKKWRRKLILDGVPMEDRLVIELVSDTFVPARKDRSSGDKRELGVCVLELRLISGEDPTISQETTPQNR